MQGKPELRADMVAVDKQLRALRKPIRDLYDELKERLDQIPTDAQHKAYAEARQKRMEEFRKRAQERAERLQARRAAATQPADKAASTQPAETATSTQKAQKSASTQPVTVTVAPARPSTK